MIIIAVLSVDRALLVELLIARRMRSPYSGLLGFVRPYFDAMTSEPMIM
jgi:hypothetical protein